MVCDSLSYVGRLSSDHFPGVALLDRIVTNEIRSANEVWAGMGLQFQTHGAPISDYYPAGSADIVQKNSNHSVTGITPSNLSQSRIGLQGTEPVKGDWSAVFKLETFFNPQSGEITPAGGANASFSLAHAASKITARASAVRMGCLYLVVAMRIL